MSEVSEVCSLGQEPRVSSHGITGHYNTCISLYVHVYIRTSPSETEEMTVLYYTSFVSMEYNYMNQNIQEVKINKK